MRSSTELAVALRQVVPGLTIEVKPVPGLDELAHILDEGLPEDDGGDDEQGDETYFGPGISPELLAAFFRGAARFARAKPWMQLRGMPVLGVSSKALGIAQGVATLFGSQGMPGLVYFRDAAAFERNLESIDASQQMTAQVLLELDEGDNVPPSMRQEVLRHQWELASPDSYPWVRVVDDDEEIRPGEPEELERMQALASAVADLCERVPKLRQKYEKELEISHTCTVPLSDGRSADIVLTLNTELEFTEEDEPAGLDAFFSSAEAEALGRRPRYAELVA